MSELLLNERECDEIRGFLDRGQKLPARYKALLFDQPHATELIWPGKTNEVANVVLPFQQIEQIDEPRREDAGADLFAWDQRTGRQTGGWTNKLIWGDNKLILSSLKNGPLRRHRLSKRRWWDFELCAGFPSEAQRERNLDSRNQGA